MVKQKTTRHGTKYLLYKCCLESCTSTEPKGSTLMISPIITATYSSEHLPRLCGATHEMSMAVGKKSTSWNGSNKAVGHATENSTAVVVISFVYFLTLLSFRTCRTLASNATRPRSAQNMLKNKHTANLIKHQVTIPDIDGGEHQWWRSSGTKRPRQLGDHFQC